LVAHSNRTDEIIASPNPEGTLVNEADLTSLDVDGFTLNWTATGSARKMAALGIKGGSWHVGDVTQVITTPATSQETGVGFTPKGVLFFGADETTNVTVQDDLNCHIGAMTGASEHSSNWWGSIDNVGDSVTARVSSTTKAVSFYSPTTPTLVAEADFDDFGPDGFTLDWTTVDSTARLIPYVAMGSNVSIGDGKVIIRVG